MRILLIGTGLTGGAIAHHILQSKKVTQLYLYSRTLKSSQTLAHRLKNTRALAIEHLTPSIKPDHVIIVLSGMSASARKENLVKSKTSYEYRQNELKYNLGAMTSILSYLRTLPKTTKIIVLTNPVDELTNYLGIILHRADIIGFGLDLDARRYSKLLKKNVYCVGTHGKAIPLINLDSQKKYDTLYKELDSALMAYIRKNGMTHKIVGPVFCEFFAKLIDKKTHTLHLSTYLNTSFYGVKNIAISAPFVVRNGKILGPAKVTLNSIERDRFQKSAEQLQKSVHHIIETHKKLISYK